MWIRAGPDGTRERRRSRVTETKSALLGWLFFAMGNPMLERCSVVRCERKAEALTVIGEGNQMEVVSFCGECFLANPDLFLWGRSGKGVGR